MGLFKKKTRRPSRRAQAKALKHKAALEAKYGARNERRRSRGERRSTGKVTKAQIATLKAQQNAAKKAAARAERELFSVSQVRKYLGVARVLAPVLAPLAYRGATILRAKLDGRRASQLGVDVAQLTDFSGPGAKLSARIANAETSTSELLAQTSSDSDTKAFAATTRDRLTSLTAAVRTSGQMPVQQRRAAQASISAELDRIESDLLVHLGVK